MRWQIADFIFCDQQQTLIFENNTQQLEPMMVELLSYFCQNFDQIISKDQLIEEVWLGRIVSDNAVSKLITKLRKAFNDDARKPKFIATFPKKGYKFIATVEQIIELNDAKEVNFQIAPSESPINSPVNTKVNVQNQAVNKSTSLYSRALFLVLIIFVITISFILTKTESKARPILTHAKALTAASGNELLPTMSPDGTRVSFMSAKPDRMHLIVKNITDERTIEISHENLGVGPASWSFDGTQLVYLVATGERCQYFIRRIEGLEVSEPKLIHNCPAGSFGKIAFTHDNNRLVFSESEGGDTPYVLFEINLLTQQKTRLTQPALFLGGNSQFDVHPTENKILISSPDKQQWEGFYSLNLDTNDLKLLFKQDAYICCGIWSHDGTRVVLMGEHPAYQLISYDLTGKDMTIIYSGSRQIRQPTRHTNGKDYLFMSGQNNTNVHLFDLMSNKPHVIAEASMDDRLATFANNHDASVKKVAYISLTTGNEEIWLTDTQGSQRVKLTHFKDSRHYVDLQWSPNNDFLMALTLNEIHLINVKTGTFERLKLPQTEIRGVSFKDNKTLAYSLKKQGEWRVNFYHIDSGSVESADAKWQYIQFTPDKNNILWQDQSSKFYSGEEQKIVKNKLLLETDFLIGRTFNLKKRAANWFWYDNKTSYALMQYSKANGSVTTLLPTNLHHFDVTENMMVFGQLTSGNTDVYTTQSLNY